MSFVILGVQQGMKRKSRDESVPDWSLMDKRIRLPQ